MFHYLRLLRLCFDRRLEVVSGTVFQIPVQWRRMQSKRTADDGRARPCVRRKLFRMQIFRGSWLVYRGRHVGAVIATYSQADT